MVKVNLGFVSYEPEGIQAKYEWKPPHNFPEKDKVLMDLHCPYGDFCRYVSRSHGD